jgi:hypothetical protein
MIHLAAFATGPTACDPLDYGFPVDLKGNDLVQILAEIHQGFFQRVSLGHGPGKTIKNKTPTTVHFSETFADNPDHNLVRHQSSLIHQSFCLEAHGAAFLDRRAQHIPGGYLGYTQLSGYHLGLSPLARSGRTQ